VTLAVNHLANLIAAFFGDGSRWGVPIDYSVEEAPLGTVGPLALIDDLPDDFLVMNGDVLCDLDYGELFRTHVRDGNDITVATSAREIPVSLGVVKYDADLRVREFVEKPSFPVDVSMGIYCLRRSALAGLARGAPVGFDALLIDHIRRGSRVAAYPFHGFWLDIGRPEDYERATRDADALLARLGCAPHGPARP
jgi:NDP-sugar pyrophosphorylase family protein